MKILKFSILSILMLSSLEGIGQTFTETFDTDPCGGTTCATFSTTNAGVQFDYTFTGGDFIHETQYGEGNSASINSQSDSPDLTTTEKITIDRNDAGDFIFNSIFINNTSGETVTVQGYNNNATVGSAQTVGNGASSTLSFGGITVDEVRITSNEFFQVNLDSFSGEIPSTTPNMTINDLALTENSTTANFTVSLSAASTSTVTVDYATANGTATAGSDYTATTGTLSFSAGETSKTIGVSILEDALYENDETFLVNLSNVTNANITDSQGQGTINNDDAAPSITLSTPSATKAESAGSFSAVATLSAVSGLSTTVNLAYSGTATSGTDYSSIASILIPAGDASNNAAINIANDLLDEADETIIVDISSVINGTESGTQQVTYTITDDDETPVVTAGQSFSVNENSAASTVVGTVAATDGDAGTTFQNWTITTNANPDADANNAFAINSSTGQITVNDAGDLNYESNTSLGIQLTVSDGTNTSNAENVTININDLDDTAPTITANTGITLDEGATETINNTELQANDADTDNATLTYSITSATSNGQLELTTAAGTSISSFTQAQLDANQVVYVHDGSNTTSDSFTFDVQDGSGNNLTGQSFSITITPVDDDTPTITANTGITLIEGATEIIDAAELQANDTDTDNDNLNFVISTSPANGQLELTSNPGTAISSFTQAQVNDTKVVYVHDDSNTTSDSFAFNVEDGSGNNLTGQTFSITINPIDDTAPTITANTGITLSEGATEIINSTELQANDADTDNATLIYSITSATSNGQLELTTNAGTSISSFTQSQLNADQVVYIHDGSNTTSDSFVFDVQDGSGNNLTAQTFNITVNLIDDTAPTITANTGITLNEGATETINNTELQANDVDTDNATLTYSITTVSSSGQLELTTNAGTGIGSFTQAQLNANEVVYVHDDSNTTSDSFSFDVQDGSGNNLTGQTFNITINPVDDDVPTITANTGITLNEGATENISSTELQANDTDTDNTTLTYSITTAGANGQLELTTNAGTAISSFTQSQLNANQVVYIHDGSNTTSDSFVFDVQDGSGNNLTAQTFNITVNLIDDTAPTITANTGITLDEGATETIENTELQANDVDTDNATLTYSITSTTSNGQMELTTNAGTSISSFTQSQLNANEVVYVHDDSNTTSDSFTFDVQDGSGNNLTGQIFSITIAPLDDDVPTITANTGIALNEGATETINNTELQSDDTDTDNTTLTYSITTAGANGQLELTTDAGTGISSFTQAQLNADQVIYVHDGNNATSDSFTFEVQDGSGNNLTGQTFSITINPIDDTAPTITANTGITLDEGATETINNTELQADDEDTDNATLTYSITTASSNGQLELTSNPGTAISSFTQSQLNASEVVYVHDGSNTISDSFAFDVEDGSGNNLTAQTFAITINPIDNTAPIVSVNTGITLEEGATKTITNGELQSDDADTDNSILSYLITSSSNNGQLELSTNEGTAISSFTQAQLNNGEVVYIHDDSETTSDSFTFDVEDGSGNNLIGETFNITINPVNDAPSISEIQDIELEVNTTGEEISFTIEDSDNEVSQLSVTATSDNDDLFPESSLSLAGSGTERFITIEPLPDATGEANVKIVVSDGDKESSVSFLVSVVLLNTAPTDISLSNSSFSEGIGQDESIGLFTTEDVDVNDTFTYSLINGSGDEDNNEFKIIGNELFLDADIDFDLQKDFFIRVRSTDNRGAFVEKSFSLTLLPDTELEPKVYSGFTPDNDGVNDTWEIDNIAGHPNIVVRIFNRNGQEIFSSVGYEQAWDGTYNGNALPSASYYYVIELNDEANRSIKGKVTILK